MDVLPIAIGVGLLVSVLMSELLGVASAGMVVPGYVALFWTSPPHLLSTAVAALATYGALRLASRFVILFGRRRTALAILLGYLAGAAGAALIARFGVAAGLGDAGVVGYIIPGLIAIWMDRQGVFETLFSLTVCSAIVRLLLLALVGAELPAAGGLQ
jgi:poly-gamma-glutamate biosynthesis protein PgsC/CapC